MAKQLLRQELYDLVWSTPMRTLAAQFGISDVGLKKACARAAIPTPDRGYWAKKEARKETFQVALPKRAPGMSDEVVVAQGANHWYYDPTEQELLDPLPSAPEFPEPIEEVRERIAAVVGAVAVPHKVKNWHPAIDELLQEDERRREQQRVATYRSWENPLFDSPFERRRLRILNALFFAVARMNGKSTIGRHEPRSIHVGFYQQHVTITLDQPAHPRRGHAATKQLRSNDDAKLSLSILHSRGSGEKRATWQDDDGTKLEARMTEIAVELILTAELQYREVQSTITNGVSGEGLSSRRKNASARLRPNALREPDNDGSSRPGLTGSSRTQQRFSKRMRYGNTSRHFDLCGPATSYPHRRNSRSGANGHWHKLIGLIRLSAGRS